MRRKKQRRRVAFRLTVFFLIVGIAIVGAVNLAWGLLGEAETASSGGTNLNEVKKRTGYYNHPFYFEAEDSCDGLLLGSSTAYRAWSGPLAFHETGIAVYGMTSKGLHPVLYKYMIEDALETQDPEVIIINLGNFPRDPETFYEENVTRVTDHMKDGQIRDAAIEAAVELFKEQELDLIQDVDWYDNPTDEEIEGYERQRGSEDLKYIEKNSRYKGFVLDGQSTRENTGGTIQPLVDTTGEIDPMMEKVFKDLLEYCKGLETEVLFLIPPVNLEADAQGRLNGLKEMARDNGFEVFDSNTKEFREETDLDLLGDFYDKKHMNAKGAVKFTSYFADYLQEKYGLPDHRGDADYESWESAYEAMMEKMPK